MELPIEIKEAIENVFGPEWHQANALEIAQLAFEAGIQQERERYKSCLVGGLSEKDGKLNALVELPTGKDVYELFYALSVPTPGE